MLRSIGQHSSLGILGLAGQGFTTTEVLLLAHQRPIHGVLLSELVYTCPDPGNTATIMEISEPESLNELWSFNGIIIWPFLPHLADLVELLLAVLQGQYLCPLLLE